MLLLPCRGLQPFSSFSGPFGGREWRKSANRYAMTGESPIAEAAMARLDAKLSSLGSRSSTGAGCGLHSLLHTLERALRGELADNYYLASLDPGQGKSLGVASFVNSWAELGYTPDEGVLIGVSRLSEIETLVTQSCLKPTEFGVLTSNPILNDLGLPRERLGTARVLFTTQQMIIRRCAGQRFAQTTAFNYRGRQRKLRVWDETLTPAEPFTVGRDALGFLLSPLRLDRPDYHKAVWELMLNLEKAEEGQRVFVPTGLAAPPKASEWLKEPNEHQRELVENLGRLAGRQALVVSDGGLGNTLVGVERSLPPDFAPAVVLDASGRVRPTYGVWSRYRGDLVRLPSAISDYANVHFHVWQQPSGRRKLRLPESRKRIVTGLAEAINLAPDSRWLVIHYKDAVQFPPELLAHVGGDADRVQFLTWGNHHGTNDYRDVANVALVGQLTYAKSAYVALALAAGLPESRASDVGRDFMDGEWAHHTLQAALRGAARKVVSGKASPMEVYMVASPSPSRTEDLKRIFPGAMVSEWDPWPKELRGQARAVAEYLSERFAAGVHRVRKREAREAVGIAHSSTFAGNILKNPAFIQFLDERGIGSVGQYFLAPDRGQG